MLQTAAERKNAHAVHTFTNKRRTDLNSLDGVMLHSGEKSKRDLHILYFFVFFGILLFISVYKLRTKAQRQRRCLPILDGLHSIRKYREISARIVTSRSWAHGQNQHERKSSLMCLRPKRPKGRRQKYFGPSPKKMVPPPHGYGIDLGL